MSDDTTSLRTTPVVQRRDTISAYVAGIVIFLFGVTMATGMLLSAYFVPSTDAAASRDGHLLGTAIATRPLEFDRAKYSSGDIVVVPLNARGDSMDVRSTIRQSLIPNVDSITGRIVRPSAAWLSVDHTISRNVELGRTIRSVHHYGSGLLIAALILEIAFAIAALRRRRPRTVAWVQRIALLALALVAGFTGSILPWNQLSLSAVRIGSTSLRESIPFAGETLAAMLFGGASAMQAALTRAYAMHVAILPVALALLVVALYRASKNAVRGNRDAAMPGDDMTTPVVTTRPTTTPDTTAPLTATTNATQTSTARDLANIYSLAAAAILILVAVCVPGSGMPGFAFASFGIVLLAAGSAAMLARIVAPSFGRHTPTRDLLAWVLLFGIVLSVAIASPLRIEQTLNIPVDLMASNATPASARPEWYLMFAYGAVSSLPGFVAVAVIVIAFALLAASPLFARYDGRGRRAQLIGLAALIVLIALTAIGYIRS